MESMPISAIGRSTSRQFFHCRGFSLLELLVVVVIVATFVGAAVLSIGIAGDNRDLEQETFRLKSLLNLLREEALMQNRDYGVLFSATGYRFYVYDYVLQTWVEPAGDTLLAGRSVDGLLELALRVEDRDIVLDEGFETDELGNPLPQVMILSSGEMTPFEADVFRPFVEEARVRLRAELDGTIEISSGEPF